MKTIKPLSVLPEGKRYFSCQKDFGSVFSRKVEGKIERNNGKIVYILRLPEFDSPLFARANEMFNRAGAEYLAYLENAVDVPQEGILFASLGFQLWEENKNYAVSLLSYLGDYSSRKPDVRYILFFSPDGRLMKMKKGVRGGKMNQSTGFLIIKKQKQTPQAKWLAGHRLGKIFKRK